MSFAGRIEALFTVPAGVTITVTTDDGAVIVPVPAGAYYLSTVGTVIGLLETLQTNLNALGTGWTVSLSTGASGTGLVTIDTSSTPYSIAWTSADLRDLLGFTVDIVGANAASVGTKHARGHWRPVTCPVMADQDLRAAPSATDLRTTTSPTGVTYGLFGNIRYRHTNVRWSHVASTQIWIGAETTANASWEYFFNETQLGRGLSWFTPSSRLQIYTHNSDLVGQYANSSTGTSGWWITGVTGVAPRRAVDGWDGLYAIELPELVTDG